MVKSIELEPAPTREPIYSMADLENLKAKVEKDLD